MTPGVVSNVKRSSGVLSVKESIAFAYMPSVFEEPPKKSNSGRDYSLTNRNTSGAGVALGRPDKSRTLCFVRGCHCEI